MRHRRNGPLHGVRVVGSNMTEVDHGSVYILYSYETPVAVIVREGPGPASGPFVTTKQWSRTTSKHIGVWLRSHGYDGAKDAKVKHASQEEVERIACEGRNAAAPGSVFTNPGRARNPASGEPTNLIAVEEGGRYAPGAYIIARVFGTPGHYDWDERDESNTVLVQVDYDFPSLARTFGWRGTGENIEAARRYLDRVSGSKVVEDPGYFERDNPRARTIPTRIPQLLHEGVPDGHGQAGAIAYREARERGERVPAPNPHDRDLLRRMRFFQAHAGGVVGETAKTAIDLARAERAAVDMDWEATWEPEPEPDLSWMDPDERMQEHVVEMAVLRDDEGNVVASLGNIVDADDTYRRVVNAELACEANAWEVYSESE